MRFIECQTCGVKSGYWRDADDGRRELTDAELEQMRREPCRQCGGPLVVDDA